MNTRSVNSAAGVILAALTQNRTAAGIALALESAGLLMSPEAAADLASTSTDAVAVAGRAVAELKREHEISAQLRLRVDEVERKYIFDTAELKRQLDSARVDGARLIRAEQRRAELEAVLGTHRKDDQAEIERLRARVAELEQQLADYTEPDVDGAGRTYASYYPEQRPTADVTPQVLKLRNLLAGQREELHDGPLAHSYRVGRDLPEMGGA